MVNLHGATRKRSDVPLDQLLESVGNVRDARWQGKPVRYIPKSDGPWFVLADVLLWVSVALAMVALVWYSVDLMKKLHASQADSTK